MIEPCAWLRGGAACRLNSLITATARALAAGDAIGALKRVALRDDPPALAMRDLDSSPRALSVRERLAETGKCVDHLADGLLDHEQRLTRLEVLSADTQKCLETYWGDHGGRAFRTTSVQPFFAGLAAQLDPPLRIAHRFVESPAQFAAYTRRRGGLLWSDPEVFDAHRARAARAGPPVQSLQSVGRRLRQSRIFCGVQRAGGNARPEVRE